MKILIYMNNLMFGGTERTITYLSDYFIKQGHQVVIVLEENKTQYITNPNIIIYNLNNKPQRNLFSRLKQVYKSKGNLYEIIKRESPDIIFPLTKTSFFYMNFFKKNSTLICSERSNPNNDSYLSKFFKRKMFKKADGIIFQTKGAQSNYSKKITKKSIVIPNAVGDRSLYSLNKPAFRNNTVLAVGRLIKEKDYPTLLRAFEIVLKKFPEYVLKIYGVGSEKENLLRLSEELDIRKQVRFEGTNPKAIYENKDSSCYVLSSSSEGMPNSLLEAMAAGIPSIATNCDYGPRDIIKNNVNGILVDVSDYKKIASSIIKIISNKEFSENISNNGREILITNSIERISDRYLNFMKRNIKEVKNI